MAELYLVGTVNFDPQGPTRSKEVLQEPYARKGPGFARFSASNYASVDKICAGHLRGKRRERPPVKSDVQQLLDDGPSIDVDHSHPDIEAIRYANRGYELWAPEDFANMLHLGSNPRPVLTDHELYFFQQRLALARSRGGIEAAVSSGIEDEQDLQFSLDMQQRIISGESIALDDIQRYADLHYRHPNLALEHASSRELEVYSQIAESMAQTILLVYENFVGDGTMVVTAENFLVHSDAITSLSSMLGDYAAGVTNLLLMQENAGDREQAAEQRAQQKIAARAANIDVQRVITPGFRVTDYRRLWNQR